MIQELPAKCGCRANPAVNRGAAADSEIDQPRSLFDGGADQFTGADGTGLQRITVVVGQ